MMSTAHRGYEDLLKDVLLDGSFKSDRTGTGTRSLFGRQLRYDLRDGFPLNTTKFVPIRLVAEELFWFLRGETNIRSLQEKNVHIWDEWADENGDLGPVYGHQWRSWLTSDGRKIDQIQQLLDTLSTDPNSRRMLVSAWNPADLPDEKVPPRKNAASGKMALAPCHAFFQVYVAEGRLSLQVYQRSADLFLGVPFNIASYALLTHMIAQQVGLEVGELIWTGGDCHIYLNHFEQVTKQLNREPYPFPQLEIRKASSLFDYTIDDVELIDYQHHSAIKGEVAI